MRLRIMASLLSLFAILSLFSACGEALHAPPTGDSADSTGGDAQRRNWNQATPLVPASESAYVIQATGAPPPAFFDGLETEYGLTLLAVEGEAGDPLYLFDGAIGVDLADLNSTWNDVVAASSTNRPVTVSENLSLVGGFVVGDWDEGRFDTGGLESLFLEDVHRVAIGEGVRIAVLDTGIDADHHFFQGRIDFLSEETRLGWGETQNGIDEDGDGEVDEAYGHGTHVAGIALQVAPGAFIVPVRVLNDDGTGSLWDLLRGMRLVSDAGVPIINLSVGLTGACEIFENELGRLLQAGTVVVAGAGNAGARAPVYPATSALTVGVAAVDPTDWLADFSGAGPSIFVAAPGVNVLSTFPAGRMAWASGTSMATPVTTGTLALVIARHGLGAIDAAIFLDRACLPVRPVGSVLSGRVDPLSTLPLE